MAEVVGHLQVELRPVDHDGTVAPGESTQVAQIVLDLVQDDGARSSPACLQNIQLCSRR